MLQVILGLLAGLGPSLALCLWLSRGIKKEPAYRQSCRKAIVAGLISTFPIILTSGALYLLLRLSRLEDVNALLYQAVYTFIVLAFSEELNKYLAFRYFLKKSDAPYSWLDLTILMTLVATGFGISESLVYLINSNAMVMLVRGIAIPHAGYGAIVGWFYGKSLKTGRRGDRVLGFVIAWLLHGLYDFGLAPEFVAINELLTVVALALAVLELALVIWLIVFAVKARKEKKYTEPLLNATEPITAPKPDV